MINYIRNRLRQPTTWLGLGSAIATGVATQSFADPVFIGSFLAAIGLIHIDERKSVAIEPAAPKKGRAK